jgi:hypothetical protein
MFASSIARHKRLAVAMLLLAATTSTIAPAGKKKRAQEPVAIRIFDVAVHAGLVYVAETTGFIAYRIGETGKPEPVGKLGLPGAVRRITFQGDLAYLAVGAQGLFVVDVTDPEQMQLLARHDPPGPVEHALLADGTAFLAENRDGLSIIDFSNPLRPRRLGRVSTRGQLRALALEEDKLATAEGTGAARIFDFSDPSRPKKIHEFREAAGARDVALHKGILFVAAGREGLLIFDPERSTQAIARVAPRSSATTVTLHGHLALVTNGGAGLQIIDVSDPLSAHEIGSLGLPDRPSIRRVTAEEDRLFLAADVGGLAVAEIADPTSPKLLHPRQRKMEVRFR